ncbi:hypothetical protein DUA64_26050 [Salmonella enterica subsp. enterica serovar Abony]|nr:hypothetical protein [Salmonella enterica subsp. enterica serovar Abony]
MAAITPSYTIVNPSYIAPEMIIGFRPCRVSQPAISIQPGLKKQCSKALLITLTELQRVNQ